MGKVFGISDLPVTIFTTPLEPVKLEKPYSPELPRKIFGDAYVKCNVNLSGCVKVKKGLIERMVNGFRKVI